MGYFEYILMIFYTKQKDKHEEGQVANEVHFISSSDLLTNPQIHHKPLD